MMTVQLVLPVKDGAKGETALQPVELDLAPPGGAQAQMIAWEIVALGNTNQLRARFAALGVCWRGAHRPMVSYSAADPAGYGGLVMADLIRRGGQVVELSEVGAEALRVLGRAMQGTTPMEVDAAAKGFAASPGGEPG